MKMKLLLLSLSLSLFAQEKLNLVGGYYHHKKESIVFECLENFSEAEICQSAQAILIKKKPKKDGRVKEVISRGKYLSFNKDQIREIEALARKLIGLSYSSNMEDNYSNGTDKTFSYTKDLVGFTKDHLCLNGGVCIAVGIPLTATFIPFALLHDIIMFPKSLKKSRQDKRNLQHKSSREQVYKEHKKIKVNIEIFQALKETLELE